MTGDDNHKPVCPECDQTTIERRVGSMFADTGYRWKCYGCGETFMEPNYRETRDDGVRTGLAGRLADPDVTFDSLDSDADPA